MADTGIFCTTAEVQRKAGANASTTANVEAYINDFVTQAESLINCATRKNWSDDYSSLNVDVKGVLKEAASNMAAIYVIQFDMSGFTSRGEAESMITILRDAYLRNIQFLRDMNVQTFIGGETP
jgi:beta-galactosidase/beta-glucuronidase